jgi:AraC-like DNA-binding protein
MVGGAESLLFSGLPERDPVAEQVADLVALITSDSSLRRVDELSVVSGLSVRALQRLFSDYVGVSPKWVMRRARLHEAALRADGGEPVDWAALASDLGYADQAHLTRDFTATIGVPPARYAAVPLRCGAVTLRCRYAAVPLRCGAVTLRSGRRGRCAVSAAGGLDKRGRAGRGRRGTGEA